MFDERGYDSEHQRSMTDSSGTSHDLCSPTHCVQLYGGSGRALVRNVGAFIADGLKQGGAALILASSQRNRDIVSRIDAAGFDAAQAIRDLRLVVIDECEALARFMVDDRPDARCFDAVIGAQVRAIAQRGPLRAYGEMVGLLWAAGRRDAAIELEALWNELAHEVAFDLFCGYPIDVLTDAFDAAAVDELLCAHTHVLPSHGRLESALDRAMVDVLGPSVAGLRALMTPCVRPEWPALPRAEAMILWLRDSVPQHAEAVLSRARAYTERFA